VHIQIAGPWPSVAIASLALCSPSGRFGGSMLAD
jgi:hypothetical protein